MELVKGIELQRQNIKDTSLCRILKSVLSLEFLSVKSAILGKTYKRIFYDKMIEKEIAISEIDKNAKIAHIGSGPYPMTAIYLAEKGFKVDCFDINEKAIIESANLVEKINLSDMIQIFNVTQNNCNYDNYDLIILSLHIIGKEEIIRQILESVSERKKVVYRNARSILKSFYPTIYPPKNQYRIIKKRKQIFFKESVLIEK